MKQITFRQISLFHHVIENKFYFSQLATKLQYISHNICTLHAWITNGKFRYWKIDRLTHSTAPV